MDKRVRRVTRIPKIMVYAADIVIWELVESTLREEMPKVCHSV
jgi:hypothetical protein